MGKVYFQFTALLALLGLVLAGCGKDSTVDAFKGIQQGDVTVGISAEYTYQGSSQIHRDLLFKYNYMVAANIDVGVDLYTHDQGKKNLHFRIPAANVNPVREINGNYLNNWFYPGAVRDTLTGQNIPSKIDLNWEVDSVKIVSVSSPDKHYGFKVVPDGAAWQKYLEVQNPKTSVQFTYGNRILSFMDYDFNAGGGSYSMARRNYTFRYFSPKLQMITGLADYPLQVGMTLDIPFMMFYDGRQYGADTDDEDGSNDTYSTIQLKITGLTSTHFSASFAGKLFSKRQPDTLFIKDGQIKNALIPVKE